MGIKSLNTLPMEYETGEFTPTVAGTTAVGTGTYTTQYGIYTKIGNVVTFYAKLTWTNLTGATGNLMMAGLPYPSNSTHTAAVFVSVDSVTFSGQLCGFTSASGGITLYGYSSNASMTAVAIDTTGSLYTQGAYFSL